MIYLYKGFTKGIITGTVIGVAVAMMMPTRTMARTGRKIYKNGKRMMNMANNFIDNITDMW